MINKKHLDFYVIGAKKTGTTSLYYYFSKMPDLCMHSCKELSFLSDGFDHSGSFEKVVENYYKNADRNLIWGAVTPHYLYDHTIPKKLNNFMPNGKFIVILRDPIERAISNYHMMRSQGYEKRTLHGAIQVQLDHNRLVTQRKRELYHGADVDSYFVWGEYGRLLELFASHISPDKILVIFLEELAVDKEKVFTQVCDFIGMEDIMMPENLGTKYNEAERKQIHINPLYRALISFKWCRKLAKSILTQSFQQEFSYKYNLGTQKNLKKPSLEPEVEQRLITHFRGDVKKLESLLDRSVPWSRFTPDGL